mmetsp:Transcript_8338/g.11969  ORF Transcript_8338/g.11969 Transcript_8338/m.11969 type:complete len:111 (-) Transcript_8338:581-913(-)
MTASTSGAPAFDALDIILSIDVINPDKAIPVMAAPVYIGGSSAVNEKIVACINPVAAPQTVMLSSSMTNANANASVIDDDPPTKHGSSTMIRQPVMIQILVQNLLYMTIL